MASYWKTTAIKSNAIEENALSSINYNSLEIFFLNLYWDWYQHQPALMPNCRRDLEQWEVRTFSGCVPAAGISRSTRSTAHVRSEAGTCVPWARSIPAAVLEGGWPRQQVWTKVRWLFLQFSSTDTPAKAIMDKNLDKKYRKHWIFLLGHSSRALPPREATHQSHQTPWLSDACLKGCPALQSSNPQHKLYSANPFHMKEQENRHENVIKTKGKPSSQKSTSWKDTQLLTTLSVRTCLWQPFPSCWLTNTLHPKSNLSSAFTKGVAEPSWTKSLLLAIKVQILHFYSVSRLALI